MAKIVQLTAKSNAHNSKHNKVWPLKLLLLFTVLIVFLIMNLSYGGANQSASTGFENFCSTYGLFFNTVINGKAQINCFVPVTSNCTGIYNKNLHACQSPISISNSTIDGLLNLYLSQNNITCANRSVNVSDYIRGTQVIKSVGVVCAPAIITNMSYPMYFVGLDVNSSNIIINSVGINAPLSNLTIVPTPLVNNSSPPIIYPNTSSNVPTVTMPPTQIPESINDYSFIALTLVVIVALVVWYIHARKRGGRLAQAT